MKILSRPIVIIALALFVISGSATTAQDRYAVQVPNGLAFSEFRGYEDWRVISVSQTESAFAAILGNPAMIEAYRAGMPGNGQPFPDGARMAKVHWSIQKSAEAPAPTTVPDALRDVDFMVKDSRRFAETGGWGYAQFNYDAATGTFTPEGTGTACGAACHTLVQSKDYVFTAYPAR